MSTPLAGRQIPVADRLGRRAFELSVELAKLAEEASLYDIDGAGLVKAASEAREAGAVLDRAARDAFVAARRG